MTSRPLTRPSVPTRALGFSAAAVLVGLGAVAPAHAAPAGEDRAAATATVSILHGVPDTPVDVYANGEVLLEDFEPGTLTDPQQLPAGEYDLLVTEPDAGADGEPLIEANDVAVPSGANATVVAHLDADGTPVLTPFVNDTSATEPGQARLTVRHTAAAPAVDVRADEEVAFSGLTNPGEDTADLPAGTVSGDVVLAGEDEPVIGPADLDLQEGTSTIVYAWGSAEDDNLDLAVQTIGDLGSAPGGVDSGTGGQVAAGDAAGRYALVGLGALAAGGFVLALNRRRVSSER